MTQSQRDKILKVLGENPGGMYAGQVVEALNLPREFIVIGEIRVQLESLRVSGAITKTNENRYQLVFGGYDPSGDAA